MKLNFGYDNTDLKDSFIVNYYGNSLADKPTWLDVLGEEYENITREGYTFLGWYTRLINVDEYNKYPDSDKEKKDICKKIDLSDIITYDEYQIVQTLYAHWQKNYVEIDDKIIYYNMKKNCFRDIYIFSDALLFNIGIH